MEFIFTCLIHWIIDSLNIATNILLALKYLGDNACHVGISVQAHLQGAHALPGCLHPLGGHIQKIHELRTEKVRK